MASTRNEFYRWADDFFDTAMEEYPTLGTWAGNHQHDHRLSDMRRENLERQQRLFRRELDQAQAFDVSNFDVDAQIDQVLMVHLIESFLREYEQVRDHYRNPSTYVDECSQGAVLLLLREFAPLTDRLQSLVGRLRATPQVLEHGKANIEPKDVPLVWAEIALQSARQGLALYTQLIPAVAAQVPDLTEELMTASEDAAQAVEDYAAFIEESILPEAAGDFAAGEDLFNTKLREEHMVDYDAEELLETGWRLLQETEAEMEALSQEMDPDKTVEQILEEAKAHHPHAEELLDVYREEMAKVRDFVVENDIATIPEGESLKIEPTPAFMRGLIPYAAYMMPGPLEEQQEGIFLVTPVDPEAPAAEQNEKLQGHHYAKLPIVALHEAYPGHHLQLVVSNTVGRMARKAGTFLSTLFVEGWAFYCEELMEDLGYIAEPIQRLGRLEGQLWRAARIVMDVSLHTAGMSVEEAVDFAVERGGLERSNAIAEVRRYTLSPTQPQSYLMGKQEILKVIDAYDCRFPETSLKEKHDAILGCGSLPPKLMRQRLFDST